MGERISDDLRIVRLIARGGMGEVYLGHQDSLARDVAIKVLKRSFAENAESAERFLQEGRAASRIKHPRAVAVHGVGRVPSDGRPYIVMEYVPGRSLGALLRDRGALKVREALAIASGVADILASAHEVGIVHRDVKPDNILIVDDAREGLVPRVLDFGIARVLTSTGERLTEAGMTYGTPDYMAPEQALGGEVDGRTDIYALALVLYEMIAGAPPFLDPSKQMVIQRQINESPKDLREVARSPIPDALAEFVDRCLAKEPADRPESMREVRAALERIVAGLAGRRRDSDRVGVSTTTSGSHRIRGRRTTGSRRAADSGPWSIGAESTPADEEFSFGDDEAPRPVVGLSGSHLVAVSEPSEFVFDDDEIGDLRPDAILQRTPKGRTMSWALAVLVVVFFIAAVAVAVVVVVEPSLLSWSSDEPVAAASSADENEDEVVRAGAEVAPSVEDLPEETDAAPEPVAEAAGSEARPRVARSRAQAVQAGEPPDGESGEGRTEEVASAAAPAVVPEPATPPEPPAAPEPVPEPEPVREPVAPPEPAVAAEDTRLADLRTRIDAFLADGQCIRADELVVEMRRAFGQPEAARHYGDLEACRAARRAGSTGASSGDGGSGGTAAPARRPATNSDRVLPPTEL